MWKHSLALVAAVACVAVAQERNPGKAARFAALLDDPRLDRPLSLRTPVLPLAEVVPEIHRQLDVDVMIQGDLLRRTVMLRHEGRPARELLADLSVLLGGTWIKRSRAYVLLTDDITAGLVKRWGGRATLREAQALALSLNASQAETLNRTHRLKLAQLTPTQQQLARTIAQEAFLESPQRFPSSVVTGDGFEIHKPEVSEPPILAFIAPVVQTDGRLRGGRVGEVYLQDLPRR